MIHLFERYTKRFETISLDGLNRLAALLDRQEHKYVLEVEQLLGLIDELTEDFYILQIGEHTAFSYKSMYFDSDELHGYRYHNQGRLKGRFKIRTRQYVESNLCFFEVKLKDKRGGTLKKRIPYDVGNYRTITAQAQQFIEDNYAKAYGRPLTLELSSQLEVSFQRITLIAKQGGERVTIDFNLSFAAKEQTTPVRQFLVVETKSSNGRGIAYAIFRRHGLKSRSCSKYCLGANLLQLGVKYNRFKPLLKLYDNLPLYDLEETPDGSDVTRPATTAEESQMMQLAPEAVPA